MSYKLLITCYQAASNTIESDLLSKLDNDANDDWTGLECYTCTTDVKCRANTNFVDIEFTLPNLGTTVINRASGVTYKTRDAILIAILQDNLLDFSHVANAELVEESVTVEENPSCHTGEYVVVGDTCVKCGKGSYRNDTTKSCEFCPVGTYQTAAGQTDCDDCLSGKTTATFGSDSSLDCHASCPPGQYYNHSTSRCEECPRHYYQHMSGQDYCLPCGLGTKTSDTGSNSSTNCYDDCVAGTELQPDGSCKPCNRGYYRTQREDNCQPCETVHPGMTTEGEGTTSSSDCNIRICYAGNFRNKTSNECKPCPVGQYQSEDLQDDCDNCLPVTKYTTNGEGKTHIDNCTFYCPAGQELVSAEQEKCRQCPRGTYRSLDESEILQPCLNCTDGNTTETVGTVTKDQCSIKSCDAGQVIDETGACKDCQLDTYQPENMPRSATVCIPCNDSPNETPRKGTMDKKSSSETQCMVICDAGEQEDGNSCSPCPQGTWSNGNETMRFEQCYNCTEGYTTEGMGSTHPDNCTLRDCDPGSFISGTDCLPCDYGQYQPQRHQDTCLDCGPNQNTSSNGSTSQADCQVYCPKGQEGNATCKPCAENYIKPIQGISACTACTGNHTANADRDTCSELFCDVGLYNESGSCLPCPVGKYKDERGNDNTCTDCDAGYTTSGVASKSKSDCSELYCVLGKFENTTADECQPCPVKAYKNVTGNMVCTDCPSDKTTTTTGSDMSSDCSLEYCSAGHYRTTNNICMECDVGKYQPDSGQTICMSCDSGFTTEEEGRTDPSDCHQICPVGFEFDTVNKVCVGCRLGFYKDVTGIDVNCTQCPVNKTTANINSTSQADCNIDDCQPGYKREAGGCVVCEKGTYQDLRSQTSCKSCGSDNTTESTGSKKQTACIKKCPDGMQYNFIDCENCKIGYYTNRTITEYCLQCPAGKTTAYAGSNLCFENTVTTPPPLPVTVVMVFKFRARFDCDSGVTVDNYKNLVRGQVITRLKVLARIYPLLCSSSCQNINLLTITIGGCQADPNVQGRKRREVAVNLLTFDIKISDVPPSVQNSQNNNVRPSQSILQEDLNVNIDEYNPQPKVLTTVSAQVSERCSDGSVQNGQGFCEPCPAGTKYKSDPVQCDACPLDTYQDETGKMSCKSCPGSVNIYTLDVGSTSSSQCVSICVKTPTYCNFGSCTADSISTYCSCNEGYTGSRCNSREEKTSSTPAIIGGAVGGGVGLLIIIMVTAVVCSRRNRKGSDDLSDHKKFGRTYDMDSDAPYRNPMYDNRSYMRPLPITYKSDWHRDDVYGHDPYNVYIAQSRSQEFELDEDYSPRGNQPYQSHEWHTTGN